MKDIEVYSLVGEEIIVLPLDDIEDFNRFLTEESLESLELSKNWRKEDNERR